jgi:lysophospholipase L1-like esterase
MKLLAVALSALLTLLVIEVATRITKRDPLLDGKAMFPNASLGENAFYESLRFPRANDEWGSPFRIDPELGFSLEPNVAMVMSFEEAKDHAYHLRTNALGLRDDRALVPKAPGTLRVLALGDSMTYGLGVEREEAFPALLEEKLAKKLGRPVEVVNAAVPCWGQWEETAFLERRARALEPDFVLLQFTISNDVLDDTRYREVDGKRVPDDSLGRDLAGHRLFQNPLATWSRAYRRFVWDWGRHYVRYEAMHSPERLARAGDLVRRARDLSVQLGAGFALTIAPPSFQVADGASEKVVRSREIDQAIVERAGKDGIAALDLGPALVAAKKAGVAGYFATDMHWSPEGHRIVAEALADWLPLPSR